MPQAVTGNFLYKLVNPTEHDLQKMTINGRAVFTQTVYNAKRRMSNLIDLSFVFFAIMVYECKCLHIIVCFVQFLRVGREVCFWVGGGVMLIRRAGAGRLLASGAAAGMELFILQIGACWI